MTSIIAMYLSESNFIIRGKKKKKESCVITEIYFALLAFTQDFVWCWEYIIKQIFHADFCLISKLFIR